MRPEYEDDDNRVAQREIAAVIVRVLDGVSFYEMPKWYVYDFRGCYADGRPACALECKDRDYLSTEFRTYMIGTKKIERAVSLVESFGVSLLLAVRWLDATGYLVVTRQEMSQWPRRMAGRKDRNDQWDIEECFFIPIPTFTWVRA